MKRDDISKLYIEYVTTLSLKWSQYFGNVWWYSLVHEKNTTISDSYHNYVVNPIYSVYNILHTRRKFIFLRMVILAVKKYFKFIVRRFLFRRIGLKRKKNFKHVKTLFVTYGDGVLNNFIDYYRNNFDRSAFEIIIPQKKNWGKLRVESLKKDNMYILDEFLPLKSFLTIHILYLWNAFKFLINRRFRKEMSEHYYITHREDIWKSFMGDVLIEGLFWEAMFKNIAKKIYNIHRIVYIYEGRAWEKALCLCYAGRTNIVGLLCTAPALGILNFFYDKKEVNIMPIPTHLGVVGKIPHDIMEEVYGNGVFVFGATVYDKLKQWMEKKNRTYYDREYITVILGSNNDQSEEILDFVNSGLDKNEFIVKPHPDNILDYSKRGYNVSNELEYCLRRSKFVIVYDSTVSLEALALGIPVVIPSLASYADTNPLTGVTDLCKHIDNPQDLKTFLEEGIILRKSDCRRFIKDYFSFRSLWDMSNLIKNLE